MANHEHYRSGDSDKEPIDYGPAQGLPNCGPGHDNLCKEVSIVKAMFEKIMRRLTLATVAFIIMAVVSLGGLAVSSALLYNIVSAHKGLSLIP